MEIDLEKWLPLGIILGLGILFIQLTINSAAIEEQDQGNKTPEVKIELPRPASDYTPPANVRIPFEYDQVISTRPVVEAAPVITADGKQIIVAPKREKKVYVSVEGILWIQNAPMASVNGRIMGVGEKYKNIQVLSISPTQVKLRAGNEIIVKTVK